jgi:hypothetical protein
LKKKESKNVYTRTTNRSLADIFFIPGSFNADIITSTPRQCNALKTVEFAPRIARKTLYSTALISGKHEWPS